MKCSIIGGAYKGRSIGIDAQECINLFPEKNGPEAKSGVSLIGTPGLKLFNQIGTSSQGCRGLFATARERLLMVVGSTLYEVMADRTYISRGHLNTHEEVVEFAEIDQQPDPASAAVSQVMLIDGVYGYIFNTATNVFTQITGDYMPGTSIVSQNGRFVQNLNDSNKWIYSNYLDGLTWKASENFFTAEASPDPILWITDANNQLWFYGSKTVEVWNYQGDINFLWSRSGVGFINNGLVGRYAATCINGHIFWLGYSPNGQNEILHTGQSYMPDIVSTPAISYIISKMETVDDCIALSYQQEGHQFAIFSFPSGNRTLCYDMSTGLWHERGDIDVKTGQNTYHKVSYLTNWQNKIMVGTEFNSNLYQWDLDTFTDNGKMIKRIRVAPHIHEDRKRVFFHELEIDFERGVGLNSGYGSDPQIMLELSNDGGFSYKPLKLWNSAGKMGERLVRAHWHKLGMSRDRVFRITLTDPVKWVLLDGRMDVSIETN